MATKKFTFDPDAGVAYGANLVVTTGAAVSYTHLTLPTKRIV